MSKRWKIRMKNSSKSKTLLQVWKSIIYFLFLLLPSRVVLRKSVPFPWILISTFAPLFSMRKNETSLLTTECTQPFHLIPKSQNMPDLRAGWQGPSRSNLPLVQVALLWARINPIQRYTHLYTGEQRLEGKPDLLVLTQRTQTCYEQQGHLKLAALMTFNLLKHKHRLDLSVYIAFVLRMRSLRLPRLKCVRRGGRRCQRRRLKLEPFCWEYWRRKDYFLNYILSRLRSEIWTWPLKAQE